MSEELSNLTFQVAAEEAGKRLDAFLSEKIGDLSRSKIQKLIDNADVLVNEKPAKPSYKLRPADEIELELTETESVEFAPEEIPLEIVYEDEFLVVINKAAGMVVHPGAGVSSGTLANALAARFEVADERFEHKEIGYEERIQNFKSKVGIVHRLDKDTSGLIVVAKSEAIHEKLSEQFRLREVFKSYIALVHGEFDENSGVIEAPIAREKHNRTRMAVRTHGRQALTLWRVKSRFEKFTLLNVEIKTGRTHQIRVHCAYINHPIVGDTTYNAGRDKTAFNLDIRQAISDLGRFFLHAERLSFAHPATGERMNFKVDLPPELQNFLRILED